MACMQVSSRNLDQVRKMKSAMTRLTARVQKVVLVFVFDIEVLRQKGVYLAVNMQKL